MNELVNDLTIVIPALNEEDAIGSTIERCLAAISGIRHAANLDDVKIVVVSDGSTDRTAEIARSYDGIKVIVFPKNRGYGAAIKAGFAVNNSRLVGFLDADGTCDPNFFAVLCRGLVDSSAKIALGSRLGPESKMPTIRRIGNRAYAFLLGIICGEMVTDTASGMRVILRTALTDLYPLPDGLHFTPAMSARALLSGMKIVEFPMPYEDRVGQSKLSVLRDGVRFLQSIIEGVLWYRPERLFLFAFGVCFLVALLLAAYPAEFYLHQRRLEEWMIYRFIVCSLFGSMAFILLAAGALAHRYVLSTHDRSSIPRFWPSMFELLFVGRTLVAFVTASFMLALMLVWPGLWEYVGTGHVTLHWSRVMVGSFCLLVGFIAFVTSSLLQMIKIRSRTDNRLDALLRVRADRAAPVDNVSTIAQ